jgi:hypothetical protein
MDKKLVNISMEADGVSILKLSADAVIIGTQYEKGATILNFKRPSAFTNDNMWLAFVVSKLQDANGNNSQTELHYPWIDNGKKDDFILPDYLAEGQELRLRVHFMTADQTEKESSDEWKFQLRPSKRNPMSAPPINPPSMEVLIAEKPSYEDFEAGDNMKIEQIGKKLRFSIAAGYTPPTEPIQTVTLTNLFPAISEVWRPNESKWIGSVTNGVMTVENTSVKDMSISRPSSITATAVGGHLYYAYFRARARNMLDANSTQEVNFYRASVQAKFVTVPQGEWAEFAFVMEFPDGDGFGSNRMWTKDHTLAVGEYQYDLADVMMVDLSMAFGAGNEPDLAWCKENIPYFVGQTDAPMLKKKLTQ